MLADSLVRLVAGAPYRGATVLLLAACGLALLPFVPREIDTQALRAAIVPALGVGSFSILLTTVSIADVPLTETSIRLAVLALVGGAFLASRRISRAETRARGVRNELVVGALLVCLVGVALASSWDVVYPLEVRGTDLGHYLLYADEVAEQERLLAEDRFAGEDGRLFADPAGVGAVYGSFLILDGLSPWTLGAGLIVLSAVSVLSMFVAAGALWGAGAGLVAASAYAVAPIRLDPMYWHGLGTTLALVFLPLVVLALALAFRGRRDWPVVALLGFALVAVATAHSTTAILVAVFVAVSVILDLLRRARTLRSVWGHSLLGPVLAAVVVALLAGAGVVAHLGAQAADLGRPVDYRFLGPDWLDRAAIAGYFSWRFLLLGAASILLVLSARSVRRDAALLSVLALAIACVVVTESWRVEFPFEYRRVVYPLGVAFALVMGAAFLRFRPRAAWIATWVLAFLAVAQLSTGLRLPERVLAGAGSDTLSVVGLREFRDRLARGSLPESGLLVTDSCLHFGVAYLVRRPTIPAYGERQVGFESRLPLARKAAAILDGGPRGRELARQLGVGYAVVDPRCTPDLGERLGGKAVIENEELVVVQLPPASQ